MNRTGLLVGLPGARKRIEAEQFKTAAGAVRIIEAGKGAYANGENGAINVWRDKKGTLRASLERFREAVESERFAGYGGLAYWLKPRLKDIRQPNERCAAIKRRIVAGDISAMLSPLGSRDQ